MFPGLTRGLTLALPGAPEQRLTPGNAARSVALYGGDYPGVRAELLVVEGEDVARGQPVFRDRRRAGIVVASPVSGTVKRIEMGPRRRLNAVVIEAGGDAAQCIDTPSERTRECVRAAMLAGGLWPAFLERPFGRLPDPETAPDAIFVTAMDTEPLAADPRVVLNPAEQAFGEGLWALEHLTDGNVYVCQAPGPALAAELGRIRPRRFHGSHPAGLPGTHIDRLHPVSDRGRVWQIGYQDVIALGHLLEDGVAPGRRIIALGGPGIENPRLIEVPDGAALDDIVANELTPGQKRVLSGSPLSGRESAYLRRRHWQVSVIDRPAPHRPPQGWLPRHSAPLRPAPTIPTAALARAIGPDLPVIPLIRALGTGDSDSAARLGARALLEDDLALAAYASGGQDLPGMLRQVLDDLEAGV